MQAVHTESPEVDHAQLALTRAESRLDAALEERDRRLNRLRRAKAVTMHLAHFQRGLQHACE